MNKSYVHLVLFVLLALAPRFFPTARAQSASAPGAAKLPPNTAAVKAGDLAPALQAQEWLKGAPIGEFEKGKVYLIEFWATWCGPCIANIPHLDDLQKKYGPEGLVVVGFTSPDMASDYKGDRTEGNSLALVRDFVAKREGMSYHVAYDTADRATYKALMGTLGGIPHAFLIGKDGRVVLGGHPYYLDEAVEQVVAGTWNYEKGTARIKQARELTSQVREALESRDYPAFKAARLEQEKEFPAHAKKSYSTLFLAALDAGDRPVVESAATALIAQARESRNSYDFAYATGQVVRANPNYKEKIKAYPGMADRLTRELLALTKSQDANALALRAEWFFAQGDAKSAAEFQRKAIDVAIGDGFKNSLRPRLETYEEAAKGKVGVLDIQRDLPQLEFTAVDGSEVDLARLRGKVVLIDFSATWCTK